MSGGSSYGGNYGSGYGSSKGGGGYGMPSFGPSYAGSNMRRNFAPNMMGRDLYGNPVNANGQPWGGNPNQYQTLPQYLGPASGLQNAGMNPLGRIDPGTNTQIASTPGYQLPSAPSGGGGSGGTIDPRMYDFNNYNTVPGNPSDPGYAAYYNSLAPSTRAFMRPPGGY